MSNHQATEQMLGYLYQVRYALYLLLENDDDGAQISIEKFDDIAFSSEDTPEVMIQVKHHTKTCGDLGDVSTDIWRTLKVWIDLIVKDITLLSSTKFLIITTAKAPEGTAASYLKASKTENERKPEMAFNLLKKVTQTSKNKAHKTFYEAFNKLDGGLAKKLISRVYIIDSSSNIVDVKKSIKRVIRYSCLPKYEDKVSERLEGWWFQKSIEYLSSNDPVFINQRQVRSKIVSISGEYTDDNLPIDISMFKEIEIDKLSKNDRIFFEQLKFICLSDKKINIAVRDYYRAFEQRAKWVRDDLLYVDELDKYENRLIDEWERLYCDMEEELDDYSEELTENVKEKLGRSLYNEIQKQDIRIRERCSEPFVMRGSYHILANRAEVGWHIDFEERLKELMGV